MSFIQEFFAQLTQLFAQQSTTKKIIATLVLIGVIGALSMVMMRYGRGVDYEVLYSGLNDDAAKKVKEELKRLNIPLTISPGEKGWSIKVPADQVLTLRLDLASVVDAAGGKCRLGAF